MGFQPVGEIDKGCDPRSWKWENVDLTARNIVPVREITRKCTILPWSKVHTSTLNTSRNCQLFFLTICLKTLSITVYGNLCFRGRHNKFSTKYAGSSLGYWYLVAMHSYPKDACIGKEQTCRWGYSSFWGYYEEYPIEW